jgi:hypothetical protein
MQVDSLSWCTDADERFTRSYGFGKLAGWPKQFASSLTISTRTCGFRRKPPTYSDLMPPTVLT